MATKKSEVQKVLRAARDLMNHGGKHWIKGRLSRTTKGEKSYCALGGIQAALGMKSHSHKLNNNTRPVAIALANAIRSEKGLPPLIVHATDSAIVNEIVTFNDNNGTTWGRMKRVFTNAAKNPVYPEAS